MNQSIIKIIVAILSIGLTISSAIGSPKSFDSNLPKPHFTEKDTNDSVVELGKLLNRDETGEFFKRAKPEFERICALESSGEVPSEEDSKTFLWIFYWVANTPLFVMDSTENARWAADNNDADLLLKEDAISKMAIDRYRELAPKYKGVDQLFASYGAAMMRNLLDQIRGKTYSDKPILIPNEDIQASTKRSLKIMLEEASQDVMNKKLSDNREQFRNYRLRVNMQNRRNRKMKDSIERSENNFMILCVDLFPGKKGEVVKYIRMAGYKDSEINDLVDRTVGRDSKTEFLYKGRSKKDAR